MPAILSTTVALLAGCAPPTGVVDLAIVAPRTQAAMQQVQILPPGELPPGEVGSVGPVAGYGCGDSPAAARAGAMQQLRIKALQMRATAVEYTVTTAASAWPCAAPYAVVANGIAVARHGVPLTYSSAF